MTASLVFVWALRAFVLLLLAVFLLVIFGVKEIS